jgi:hypothetical protein
VNSAERLADDAEIGRRARDLLRSFSEFADLVAIDAPTPLLARQMDELEKIFAEVDALAGTSLYENDVWSVLGDMGKLMRLYEVLQHRQAQKAASE